MSEQGKHAVWVEGPLRYPGGKDGAYVMRCECGWTSSPAFSPVYRELWHAARDHQVAKRGL